MEGGGRRSQPPSPCQPTHPKPPPPTHARTTGGTIVWEMSPRVVVVAASVPFLLASPFTHHTTDPHPPHPHPTTHPTESMASRVSWQGHALKPLPFSPVPFSYADDEEYRASELQLDGKAALDGNWLCAGPLGLFVVALAQEEVADWQLVFVPNEQLQEGRLGKGGLWQQPSRVTLSLGQGHKEPLMVAASWDGHYVAVGYTPGDGDAGGSVDVFHVGDLQAKDPRPRASVAVDHAVRALAWTKAGRHRLLVGGGQGLTVLCGDANDGTFVTQPVRRLAHALAAADWSPSDDETIALSCFGQGPASGTVASLFDPYFQTDGTLTLEKALTGEVVRRLPCGIRHWEAAVDEEDVECRADRHNVVHLAWLAPDLLVGVNRRGSVGLMAVASAPAQGFEPSGLNALEVPIMESRFFAALMADASGAVRFLFVTHSLDAYVQTADLTKPVEAEPNRKTGQPRARRLEPAAVDEGLPLVLEGERNEAVPEKQRACGLALITAKTGLGAKLHAPHDPRPLLVAAGVGGTAFFFALQDGGDGEVEQRVLVDAPQEKPAPARAGPKTAPATTTTTTAAKPSGFGGFGLPTPATASSAPAPAPFSFASATPAPAPAPAPASSGGFGFGKPLSSSSSSSSSAFGGGGGGFGAGAPAGGGLFKAPAPAPSSGGFGSTTGGTFSFASSQAPAPTPSTSASPQAQPSTLFKNAPAPAAKPAFPSAAAASAQVPLPSDSDTEDEEEEEERDEEGAAAVVEAAKQEERWQAQTKQQEVADKVKDQEDALLAKERFKAIPAHLSSDSLPVPASSNSTAPAGSPEQVLHELLELVEHRSCGDVEVAGKLARIKEPATAKERRDGIRRLKHWALELLDRVQLFEAEVGGLEERTRILYGKQLELARKLRQVGLLVEQEEERRQEGQEGGGAPLPAASRPWEADFLDAFACVERETLVEDVEELARLIARLLARGPHGSSSSNGGGGGASPTMLRSPPGSSSKSFRQGLRERHGQLRRRTGGAAVDGEGLKVWVGSQAEAQLREDVVRELKAVWQEKDALWHRVGNDPQKGFYLEKARAQRRQHDRWTGTPSKGGGCYGADAGEEDENNHEWYGSSALALRDGGSSSGMGGSHRKRSSLNGGHMAVAAATTSSSRRGGVLQEARRVAVLLGRVREELVKEEEVEVQVTALGVGGAAGGLEALRQKREERIQENKRKTVAQVRTAASSTATPPPQPSSQAPPKPASSSMFGAAKQEKPSSGGSGLMPWAMGGAAAGGGGGGGGATTLAAKAPAPSAASASFGAGSKGEGGGSGGAFSFANATTAGPKKAEAKPATAGAGYPPMASKAPSVFNPSAGTTAKAPAPAPAPAPGTLFKQPSMTGLSAAATKSTAGGGGGGGGGTAAFPPMPIKAPKPFQIPGATTTPASSSSSAPAPAPAPKPAEPATTASTGSSGVSLMAAKPSTSSSSSSSFGFGGLGLGGATGSAPAAPVATQASIKPTSLFGQAPAPAPTTTPPPDAQATASVPALAPAPAPAAPSLTSLAPAQPAPTTTTSSSFSFAPGPAPLGGGALSTPVKADVPKPAMSGFGNLSLAPTTPSPAASKPGGLSLAPPSTPAPAPSPFGGGGFKPAQPSTLGGGGSTTGFGGVFGQQPPSTQATATPTTGGFGGGGNMLGGGGGGGVTTVGFGTPTNAGGQGGPLANLPPVDRMAKFYERYEPTKVAQVPALWAKYQNQAGSMWLKLFTKYNVSEGDRIHYFPEYGQQQQQQPQQQRVQAAPLTTATSAQFGKSGSGLGTGLFGSPSAPAPFQQQQQQQQPAQGQSSGFASFAAKGTGFGAGGGGGGGMPSTGFGAPGGTGFGTPQQSRPTGFGQPQQPQSTGFGAPAGGGFGGGAPSTPFGQGAPQGGGMFGQGGGQPTGFGFGQQQPQQQQQQQQQPFGGGSWGQQR